ncbi:MAG: hypothetical protein O2782_04245 [bacterium]|nr:hypothetical protein [bacterium]
MKRRLTITSCVGVLCLVLTMLSGCGSSNDRVAGSADDPVEPRDGRVAVDNRTPWDLEAVWLWESEPAGAQILRVLVPPGQKVLLQEEPWPARAELVLDLVLLVPAQSSPRVRRKARVQIDGDHTVVVSASADDPFAAVVSIEP